ncbi:MAG: MFS transporter [Candidatus Rokubacteria bacterium]|nr:MFS transporter [Candidatus Rokubacteria bacterium]
MRAQKFFYGWVVLGAAFLTITMAIGTLFALGVFLKPIEEGMGWSRGAISSAALLNWLIVGLGSFVSGYISDRVGTRTVVLAGGLLLGLGLVLGSQVSTLWQFYLTFGLLVGAGVSAFYVPLTATATKWFSSRRGLAVAIVSAGNGLGVLLLSPLSRFLISAFDWRIAMLILGDLAWLVVIPAGLLIRNSPQDVGAVAHGEAVAAAAPATLAASPTAGSVLRSGPFWTIALTHFACCAAHSGPIFHMVAHAMDLGVAKMAAATVLGVSGFSSIFGRLGTGLLADRFGARQILVVGLGLQAFMILLFLLAGDLASFYGLAVAFGMAYGGVMPLYALLTREHFGERVMGTAYGGVFFISSIGMGVGSYAGGYIFDLLGSYRWLYLGSFAIGLAGVLLASTLRRPEAVPAPVVAPVLH